MSTSAPLSGPGQPPAARRRVMRTGTVIFLIAAGAILRFAVAPGSPHGLNVHVVGIVLMLAGVLGLLVALLVRRPLNRHPLGQSRRRQENEDPGSTEIKEAAAARVAAVLENDGSQPPPEQPSRA